LVAQASDTFEGFSTGTMANPSTYQHKVLDDLLTQPQLEQLSMPWLQEVEAADRVMNPSLGLSFFHRQSQPREQLVVWCGFEPGTEPTELMPGRPKHRSCRASVHFARWLFAQARGQITPFSALVVSWREAKPCLAAIGAAQTGNDADLRIDGKRRPLRPIIGHPAAGCPRLAVGKIIIAVDRAGMSTQVEHLIMKSRVSFEGIRLQLCQLSPEPERAQPAQLERPCPDWLRSPISGLSTASSSSSASPRHRGAGPPVTMFEVSCKTSEPSTDAVFGLGFQRFYV